MTLETDLCGNIDGWCGPLTGVGTLGFFTATYTMHDQKQVICLRDNTGVSAHIVLCNFLVNIAGEISILAEAMEILAYSVPLPQASQSAHICTITPLVQKISVDLAGVDEVAKWSKKTTADRITRIEFMVGDWIQVMTLAFTGTRRVTILLSLLDVLFKNKIRLAMDSSILLILFQPP